MVGFAAIRCAPSGASWRSRQQGAAERCLPADVQAVRLARRAARDALAGWQLEDLAEPAVLIVSELVTNAVRHAGKTGAITLELTSAGTCAAR